MSITQYAQERWEWTTRRDGSPPPEEDVATAYIKLAMASRDPVQMLLPAVRAAVFETFRAQRLKIEDRAWKVMPTPATETRGRTAAATGLTRTKVDTLLGTRHAPSTLDAINELLRTQLWVWRIKNGRLDGMMIPWADLTVTDIDPTIAKVQTVIAGHARRIERLEKARAMMLQHQVTRFGDIPWNAEMRELITA